MKRIEWTWGEAEKTMFLTGNSEGPLLAKTFGARERGEGNKEEDFGSECPSLSSLSSVEN
jgi:hypothetical protein